MSIAVEHSPDLLPLAIDLDGTLIRSDSLIEGLSTLTADWRIVPSLLYLLSSGRAAFKRRIAELSPLDPALLPYNENLLAYLRSQKSAGRRLVLATAADATLAHAVAAHLGLFDEVIASDGVRNLKGETKAAALVERFGIKGFAYAGNSRADLAVWRVAQGAVVVNAPGSVTAAAIATTPLEAEIDDRVGWALPLLRTMRPHQWVKNLLVFVPIATAQAYGEASAWLGAIVMFAAFCATASAIYIINDLTDLAADRAHPRKRLRAFARGSVPLPAGMAAALVLLGMGCAAAWSIHTIFIIGAYAAGSILYSLKLKELPLVDVFCLAGFYTIRLFGGGEATGHSLSLWLLGFSSFLFFSLALMKRVEELMAVGRAKGKSAARRGYFADDAATLQIFGCAASFASSVVLALFVQNEATAQQYNSPGLLWGIVPLMLFWQCRLWLSTTRGYMHEDPIIYAARDWVTWAVGVMLVVLLVAAKSTTLFAS